MKGLALKLGGLALVAVLGGLLVAWSGLIPIGAAAGHWRITGWFLHFAMRHSVATYANGVAPPEHDLSDPALILRGAGHYQSGCAPCHGTPDEQPWLVVREMTPRPPHLPPQIKHWQPSELFWIVKHGIKLTGMPAWPAQQREDEIWSVVAFLLRLPELSPPQYRELAFGDATRLGASSPAGAAPGGPLRRTLEDCARCHGADGDGRGSDAFPSLAGQNEAYLLASLRAYAAGDRHSGMMQPVAGALDEPMMRELAAHYAAKSPPRQTTAPAPESELWRLGERIATQGLPDQGVPACVSCHRPEDGPRNPIYPRLGGQYQGYLNQQLQLWRQGIRGGSPYAHLMHTVGQRLNQAQIDALAMYYASQ